MSSHSGSTHRLNRGASPLIARDPRFLIVGFALIIVSAFVVPSTWGLLVVCLYVVALHRLAGLPSRSLAGAARIVGPFILIIVVVNAVLVEGEPFTPSIRFISRRGVASGLHGGVRVLVLYSAAAVFLGLTSAEDFAKGVSSLVRPLSPALARRSAMYGFLSFGFLPLFVDELRRIVVAQRFRGAEIDRGFLNRLIGVRLLVVPLVVSAIHRSDQLAASVELRDVRTKIARILVVERASRTDYLFLIVTLAVLVGAFVAF